MPLLCRDIILSELDSYKKDLSAFCDAYHPLHDRLTSINFSLFNADEKRNDIRKAISRLYANCDEWLYGALEGSTAYYAVLLIFGEISPLVFIGLTLFTSLLTNCLASPYLCCNPSEETYTELSEIAEKNDVEVKQTNYPVVLSTFKQKLVPVLQKEESQHAFYMCMQEKNIPINLLLCDSLAEPVLPRIILYLAGFSTDPKEIKQMDLALSVEATKWIARNTFEASTSLFSFFKKLKKQEDRNRYTGETVLENIYGFAGLLPRSSA